VSNHLQVDLKFMSYVFEWIHQSDFAYSTILSHHLG